MATSLRHGSARGRRDTDTATTTATATDRHPALHLHRTHRTGTGLVFLLWHPPFRLSPTALLSARAVSATSAAAGALRLAFARPPHRSAAQRQPKPGAPPPGAAGFRPGESDAHPRGATCPGATSTRHHRGGQRQENLHAPSASLPAARGTTQSREAHQRDGLAAQRHRKNSLRLPGSFRGLACGSGHAR